MAKHPKLGSIDTSENQELGLWAAWQNDSIAGTTHAEDIDTYAIEQFLRMCDKFYADYKQSELIYHIDAYKLAPKELKESIDQSLQPYRPVGPARKK